MLYVFVFVFALCFPCCGILSFLASPRLVAYCRCCSFYCVVFVVGWLEVVAPPTVWVIQCHSQRHLGISVPPVWRHVTSPALQCWLRCHNFSCVSLICFCWWFLYLHHPNHLFNWQSVSCYARTQAYKLSSKIFSFTLYSYRMRPSLCWRLHCHLHKSIYHTNTNFFFLDTRLLIRSAMHLLLFAKWSVCVHGYFRIFYFYLYYCSCK